MIVLDTHIWVWWVHGDSNLPPTFAAQIDSHEQDGLGVSAISCWEVAKLVEYGRTRASVSDSGMDGRGFSLSRGGVD